MNLSEVEEITKKYLSEIARFNEKDIYIVGNILNAAEPFLPNGVPSSKWRKKEGYWYGTDVITITYEFKGPQVGL
jgi:hypothetical protein